MFIHSVLTNFSREKLNSTTMSLISEAFKLLAVDDDYDKVYRVLHEYLLTIKHYNDMKAFKACLVALINLDRYQEAYKLIRQHLPPQFADDLILEIAYVYYKLGRNADLAKLTRPTDPVAARGFDHIVAQSAYRAGAYGEAARIYTQIAASDTQYDSAADLKVNQLAVQSQLLFTGAAPDAASAHNPNQPNTDSDDALATNYDYLFNCALIDLAHRRRRPALATLARAADLCRHAGDDDVTPILVAIGYIYQQLGELDKAQSLYMEAPAPDDYYQFIVKNNLALVAPESVYDNPNLVARDLNFQANGQKLLQKLTQLQRQTMAQLDRVLSYVAGANGALTGLATSALSDITLDVLALLATAKILMSQLTQQPRALGRRLLPYADPESANTTKLTPRQQTAALLLLAYLAAQQDNYDQLLPVLEKLVQAQIASNSLVPAVLGVLLSVYDIQNLALLFKKRWQVVGHVLTQFIEGQLDQFPVSAVQQVALQALTESKDHVIQDAGRTAFSKLAEAYPHDKVVQAVVALSTDGLASVDLLTEHTDDLADLLAAPLDKVLPDQKKKSTTTTKKATTTTNKVTKLKKKTPKFGPKKVMQKSSDYTDADPERWMPMKMRLYYKPTKKDKKKMGGHQGALEKKKKK